MLGFSRQPLPAWLHAANRVAAWVGSGSAGLTPERLMADAARSAGLPRDFPGHVGEALEVLCGSLREEPGVAARALASGLRLTGDLAWGRSNAQAVVLLTRRAPAASALGPTLTALDGLRSRGARLFPIVGRAPSEEAELVLRLLAAASGGDLRRRSHWADHGAEPEVPYPCGITEGIEASLIRMIRGEIDGRRAPRNEGMVRSELGKVVDGRCTETDPRAPHAVTRALRPVFRPGEATMDPHARAEAARIAELLKEFPAIALQITGHSDDREASTADARRHLSLRRAQSVERMLLARGVEPARVTVVGGGDSTPRSSNESSEGRARNRRVEIELRAAH